jgi:hypothetical protein
MSLIRCPFCERGNPADAKFCSECGGALHLAPCPTCGAVNQVGAGACYQCRSPLHGRGGTASAPTPLHDLLSMVEERGTAAPAPTLPADLLLESSRGPVAPESLAVALVSEPSPVRAVSGSLLRRRSPVIAGMLVIAAVAILVYSVHWQLSRTEGPRPQAAGGEASEQGAAAGIVRRNAAGGIAGAPSAAGVGAASAVIPPAGTPLVAPVHSTADQPGAGRGRGEAQKARAVVPPNARRQAPSADKAGTPQELFAPETCTEAVAALGLCVMSPARKKALETTAAVSKAAGRAPATVSDTSGGQAPAGRKCSEAVAALGLCPPDITQRRE